MIIAMITNAAPSTSRRRHPAILSPLSSTGSCLATAVLLLTITISGVGCSPFSWPMYVKRNQVQRNCHQNQHHSDRKNNQDAAHFAIHLKFFHLVSFRVGRVHYHSMFRNSQATTRIATPETTTNTKDWSLSWYRSIRVWYQMPSAAPTMDVGIAKTQK